MKKVCIKPHTEDDGTKTPFFRVSGVAGYHTIGDALRIARQIEAALDSEGGYRPQAEVFTDGPTADEVESELAKGRRGVTPVLTPDDV